jgi:hypothetical protein
MQVVVNPRVLRTGDYAIIINGQDEVGDGQVCRVLSPDEDASPHFYDESEPVALLCWTGFVVWSEPDNLIPIEGDAVQIDQLFALGISRVGSQTIPF